MGTYPYNIKSKKKAVGGGGSEGNRIVYRKTQGGFGEIVALFESQRLYGLVSEAPRPSRVISRFWISQHGGGKREDQN